MDPDSIQRVGSNPLENQLIGQIVCSLIPVGDLFSAHSNRLWKYCRLSIYLLLYIFV